MMLVNVRRIITSNDLASMRRCLIDGYEVPVAGISIQKGLLSLLRRGLVARLISLGESFAHRSDLAPSNSCTLETHWLRTLIK